eukprot:TRINITY_DN152_c0_g1_i1.p1 TRINITY_DN152_c0_g1~~TRINITY_DN152_c0_g1_i1.p1  ORF type:complete len:210 (-),score=66.19 TRINITY_DN152_c0_g1_i1:85-714(-)
MGIIHSGRYRMKIALVVVLALAIAVSRQQVSPVQGLIIGMHNGVNLGANLQVVGQLGPNALNLSDVGVGFVKLGSDNKFQRLAGVPQLYADFYYLAVNSYGIITQDTNFTRLMNFTTTLLSNTNDFLARCDRYIAASGVNLYARVAQAANLLKAGDFYNAGVNFGWVILQVANTQQISLAEVPVRSLHRDPPTEDDHKISSWIRRHRPE